MSNVTEQIKHEAYIAYCEKMKGVTLQGFGNVHITSKFISEKQ